MKKDIILFVSIFMVLLLISGGTYAYWSWGSDTNKSVVFNTSKGIEEYIVYDAGNSYFVGDFQPSADYCNDAIYNTISFGKNDTNVEIPLVATINMDVNHIADSIKNSDNVYWVLIAGESSACTGNLDDAVAYGTFKNVNSGTRISLLENVWIGADQLVYYDLANNEFYTNTSKKYTVYIWINSAGSNSSLSGSTIDVNVWTQIDQVGAWYGDVTLDGKVGAGDYAQLTAYLMGRITLTPQQLQNADVDGDGEITVDDKSLIQQFCLRTGCLTLPLSQCN